MRRIKNFNDAMIMDTSNCVALFKLDSVYFDDHQKLDYYPECAFKDTEWIETDWKEVNLDFLQESYTCKRTLISKSFVDWYIKVAKAFFTNTKINLTDIRLYESKEANTPVLLTHQQLGCIIAPRVDNDGDESKFKDYTEPKKSKPKKGGK